MCTIFSLLICFAQIWFMHTKLFRFNKSQTRARSFFFIHRTECVQHSTVQYCGMYGLNIMYLHNANLNKLRRFFSFSEFACTFCVLHCMCVCVCDHNAGYVECMDMSAHVERRRIVDFESMLNGYIKWILYNISYFSLLLFPIYEHCTLIKWVCLLFFGANTRSPDILCLFSLTFVSISVSVIHA